MLVKLLPNDGFAFSSTVNTVKNIENGLIGFVGIFSFYFLNLFLFG
jgi:hypothetical protein